MTGVRVLMGGVSGVPVVVMAMVDDGGGARFIMAAR